MLVNLTITASLAPRHTLFSVIYGQRSIRASLAPRQTLFSVISTQGSEGPFRVLEKAGR